MSAEDYVKVALTCAGFTENFWVAPTGTHTESGEHIGRVVNVLIGGAISFDDIVSYTEADDVNTVTGVLSRSGRLAVTITADIADDDLSSAAQWTTQRKDVYNHLVDRGAAVEGGQNTLLIVLAYRPQWATATSSELAADPGMSEELGALLPLDMFTVDVTVDIGPAGGDPHDAASLELDPHPPAPRSSPTIDQIDAAMIQLGNGYQQMFDRLTAAGFIPKLMDQERFDAQLSRVIFTDPLAAAAAAAGNIAAAMVLAARIEASEEHLMVADLPGYVFEVDFDEIAPQLS